VVTRIVARTVRWQVPPLQPVIRAGRDALHGDRPGNDGSDDGNPDTVSLQEFP